MLRLFRDRKGQGFVEHALIIAGVALICAVGISVFGHKVSHMINTTTMILPGAHPDDNGPIASGRVIETTSSADGSIFTDVLTIEDRNTSSRLMENVWGTQSDAANTPDALVADPAGTMSNPNSQQ
jgi:pilus assembly protein Flp/PilA